MNTQILVSVIVPIYAIEDYLGSCLDSLLCQTWHNLDIILVDDGSPDNCGMICDSYAKIDSRIRVFHTANRGLSAARNFGIERAMEVPSKYLLFVDGDDWIENNMIETLAKHALEDEMEVVMCGEYHEFPGRNFVRQYDQKIYSGTAAARLILLGEMDTHVMNKLWKKECFTNHRFPEGRVFEDVSTVYLVYLERELVENISDVLYHYRYRHDSIVHTKDLKSVYDLWISCQERYNFCKQSPIFFEDHQVIDECLKGCVISAGKLWRLYCQTSRNIRVEYKEKLQYVAEYIKKETVCWNKQKWPLRFRVSAYLSRSATALSFITAFILDKCWTVFHRKHEILYGENT